MGLGWGRSLGDRGMGGFKSLVGDMRVGGGRSLGGDNSTFTGDK